MSANLVVTAATLVAVTLGGCRRSEASANPAPEGSASSDAVASAAPEPTTGLPFAESQLEAVLNPSKRPPYKGPVGSVVGKITIKGDPSPKRAGARPDPVRCGKEAAESHDKLLRVGPSGELADAIVGVTGYNAYLPNDKPVVDVKIRACTFDQRSIVLTYGQRIEVQNLDVREAYLPHLEGAKAPALLVAMPGGDPIKLYPPKPGAYMLFDDLKHPWMVAEVFVFKYPTVTVSDKAGAYKIDGIPVGSMKVSVRHPDIGQTLERAVEVVEGKATEVNFEIDYKAPPKAAPSASGPKVPLIH